MTPIWKENVHEGQSENKDESQRGTKLGRIWSKELVHLLCDLCIQYVEKHKGKNGEVTSQRLSWKKIELEFQKKTNLQWDKMKLKGKVDWMKARWGLWKQLKGNETGLGWDHEKGTISATDEWWALKIKENSKFEAFREEGFEFELETKMDQMFCCYAQGAPKFTPIFDPTQGNLQQEDDEVHAHSPPCNDTPGRISWSKELIHILCDLCIQYVEKRKGKNGEVTSQRLAWKKIELEFQKKTTLQWDKMKLKGKLDWMKTRWGLWKQLKGNETGLGWDREKGTIIATDEWWALKIKENSKFEAFREEGFEFELETKMDQMFCCYAQGTPKFTPIFDSTQGYLQQEDDEVHVHSPPCNDTPPHVHLDNMDETYGGRSMSNNARDDMWRDPTSNPILTHRDTQVERDERRRGKRALENDLLQSSKCARIETTKNVGGAITFCEKLDNMLQIIGDKSNISKGMNMLIMDVLNSMTTRSRLACWERESFQTIFSRQINHDSITDALEKLCALPGLESGTPEFYFACTLIEDPQKRSILFGLPNDKMRVNYIKFLYEEQKKH